MMTRTQEAWWTVALGAVRAAGPLPCRACGGQMLPDLSTPPTLTYACLLCPATREWTPPAERWGTRRRRVALPDWQKQAIDECWARGLTPLRVAQIFHIELDLAVVLARAYQAEENVA